MREFILNKYIKLRLEDGKTNIYVNNELFRQCKYLLIHIPKENLGYIKSLNSIDEAEEILDISLKESSLSSFNITPDQEFWAHCSNLQAWAENDYDTRLLHRTIAFPLLKKLVELGDSYAEITLKEEIIKRFESGHPSVIKYLISEGYIKEYLKEELLDSFLSMNEIDALKGIGKLINREPRIVEGSRFFDQPLSPQYSLVFKKKTLSGLDLRFNNLKEFPSLISQFRDLEKLYLDDNSNLILCNLRLIKYIKIV